MRFNKNFEQFTCFIFLHFSLCFWAWASAWAIASDAAWLVSCKNSSKSMLSWKRRFSASTIYEKKLDCWPLWMDPKICLWLLVTTLGGPENLPPTQRYPRFFKFYGYRPIPQYLWLPSQKPSLFLLTCLFARFYCQGLIYFNVIITFLSAINDFCFNFSMTPRLVWIENFKWNISRWSWMSSKVLGRFSLWYSLSSNFGFSSSFFSIGLSG